MINLAYKDVSHNLGRFGLTAVGLGMLLMTVMGMGGIYRGLVEDATLLVDSIGADLWVVQHGTRGPFAEISRVPVSLVDRLLAVPGVATSREFVFHTVQRTVDGKPLRAGIVGLSWPRDRGEWLPLSAGRALRQNHLEMVADQELGLTLCLRGRVGHETYTVVGLTRGMLSSAGDGLGFFTARDALAIQAELSGEATRLERAARGGRARTDDLVLAQPALVERAQAPAAAVPVLGGFQASAVLVTLAQSADPAAVARALAGWADVTVHSRRDQEELLLRGSVDRSRRQIGLLRGLLTVISTIIMALILYTLTLDKVHSIAILKLIGASDAVIVRMILQQALLLGALGYGIAYLLGQKAFPRFPRRVILTSEDLVQLAAIVFGICVLASFLGIWRALRVTPAQALEG